MADPLAVVVVHWRHPEWCAATVGSIGAAGTPTAITVVNNSPELATSMRALPASTTIIEAGGNRGYAGGANLGLRAWARTGSEFVLVCSHDVRVEPGALDSLVAAATAHPGYGILGPILGDKPIGASSRAAAGGRDGVVAVDWLSGTCLLLRRACIAEVGGFDEALGSYYEDVELCWRAAAHGWEVGLVTDSLVNQLGSVAPDAFPRAAANLVRIEWLHHGRWAAATATASLAVKCLRCVVGACHPGRPTTVRRQSWRRAVNLWHGLRRLPTVLGPACTDVGLGRSPSSRDPIRQAGGR